MDVGESLVLGEKIVIGSIAYQGETAAVIDLIADKKIDPDGFITGRIPFVDAVEKGFKELVNNPDKHIKVLLHP